jgi:adenine-specific DNA-methyltransferase
MNNLDLGKEINRNLTVFPTTRYQGSKRRLLPWFYEIFDEIEFESVLDGFGGSASVSYLFKLMGKRVFFNDILKSNYQTGVALIENDSIKLENHDIEFLLSNSNPQFPSFITDTFEDTYYYPEENRWLDLMVFNIGRLSQIYEDDMLRKKQALAFHALFQACLSKRPFNLFHRKNLYLRKADVSRTFGNKKTWDLEFSHLFQKFALEASSKVFSNNQANKAFCSDLLLLKNQGYDLVYLDPPYQRPSESRPKDYYSLYHFLEGLVDYDNWPSRVDYSKKHRPLQKDPSESDDLSSLERIDLILEEFNESIVAISYGDPGKPTITELRELLSRHKRYVKVFDTEFSYKLNKKNGSNLREALIIGSQLEL